MQTRVIQTFVLIVLATVALFVIRREPKSQTITITDFQTCQAAGGAILQSEPVQCVAFDGRKFDEAESVQPEVVVTYPPYGDLVTSPLTVTGTARGNWFFEASLPVTLKDDQGNILVKTPATTQSDWMTTDFVPFSATLNFDPGTAQYGVLIIEKDNPSGDPQFDSSFAVPVRFK